MNYIMQLGRMQWNKALFIKLTFLFASLFELFIVLIFQVSDHQFPHPSLVTSIVHSPGGSVGRERSKT